MCLEALVYSVLGVRLRTLWAASDSNVTKITQGTESCEGACAQKEDKVADLGVIPRLLLCPAPSKHSFRSFLTERPMCHSCVTGLRSGNIVVRIQGLSPVFYPLAVLEWNQHYHVTPQSDEPKPLRLVTVIGKVKGEKRAPNRWVLLPPPLNGPLSHSVC